MPRNLHGVLTVLLTIRLMASNSNRVWGTCTLLIGWKMPTLLVNLKPLKINLILSKKQQIKVTLCSTVLYPSLLILLVITWVMLATTVLKKLCPKGNLLSTLILGIFHYTLHITIISELINLTLLVVKR